MVKLPFKSEAAKQSLGESRSTALATWQRTEKRLEKDENLSFQYHDFLKIYEQLGHMTAIPKEVAHLNKYIYLPHHAVLRESSLTTKLRVVFNASSLTRSGVSLNDVLCTGEKLQNDIMTVITNWRVFRFVLTADITKMFRQIMVAPEDRHYQCIVWRRPGESEVTSFELNTVTYGTRPAPYLSNRVIKELVNLHKDEFPLAKVPLSRLIHVDDVLFGANEKKLAIQTRDQVEALLAKGELELRKWVSNDPDLLPPCSDSSDVLYLEPEKKTERKVLGIV